MKSLRTILLCAAAAIPGLAQTAPTPPATPCAGLPSGKHSLLERFTAEFGLTCEQQPRWSPCCMPKNP